MSKIGADQGLLLVFIRDYFLRVQRRLVSSKSKLIDADTKRDEDSQSSKIIFSRYNECAKTIAVKSRK